MGAVIILRTMKGTYKGADSLYNASRLSEVLSVTQKANPLVESLRTTGKLPANYVTKSQAGQKGWEPGKALGNHVPGVRSVATSSAIRLRSICLPRPVGPGTRPMSALRIR